MVPDLRQSKDRHLNGQFGLLSILEQRLVVLSSDFVGVFCLPNSTESEKNFYVIRDKKALESVQNYRLVMTS